MFSIILIACALVAVTVVLHAAGLTVLLRSLARWNAVPPTRFWPIVVLVILVTWWLILFHLAEISVWAIFYLGWECLPDVETAFYFSGVTYTTIGYGDLVLATPWRLLGPIEGLTGILMCGLSASVFFAVIFRIHREVRRQKGQEIE